MPTAIASCSARQRWTRSRLSGPEIQGLSPGAVVPCAVWEDDELIAMRLRADLGGASEFTMSQRVAGAEVLRATGQAAASSHGELIYTLSASWVRQLAAVDIEVLLSAHEGGEERPIGSYTLVHGGSFHR